MVVHEITFADIHGRVDLAEFLRLAGLVAAGAADADDLALEFCREEVTLTMSPQAMACTESYQWYLSSFTGYQRWQDSLEARSVEERDRAYGDATEAYRDLLLDAARAVAEAGSAATVEQFTVPVVRALRLVHGGGG